MFDELITFTAAVTINDQKVAPGTYLVQVNSRNPAVVSILNLTNWSTAAVVVCGTADKSLAEAARIMTLSN